MTGSIRSVAYAFLGLLAITAVALTIAATHAGSQYGDDPRNQRSALDLDGPRGRMITADGVVVAEDAGDLRSYPRGPAYAHLVGYDNGLDRTGLERTRIHEMLSRDDGSLVSIIVQLTGGDLGPPDLRLTIVDAMQRAAIQGLGDRTGAVIAIDPTTGAVLAYASTPSFDPNQIANGSLAGDDIDPLRALDRVAHRLLPPGSTFKTIVAAAALERGATSETRYDDAASYTPVGGIAINNASPGPCADGVSIEFLDALVVSCNVVFAALAVELGADAIVSVAERVGFNAPIPWELGGEVGVVPSAQSLATDIPALAQSGIGERDVRATPFLMAMLAAAVANDGVLMAPHVVEARIAPNDAVISSTSPYVLRRLFPQQTAAELRDMMLQVVSRGTGTAAAVGGLEVAGKTGTAEGGGGPHAWFIGFAPFDSPRVAIAVVVEGGGSGGRVAAPIASNVLAAWLSAVGE